MEGDCLFDTGEDNFRLHENLAVCRSYDMVALCLEHMLSCAIYFGHFRHIVYVPIDFNDEFMFIAIKIDNKIVDAMLSSKLEIAKLSVLQQFPECALRRRHTVPKLFAPILE